MAEIIIELPEPIEHKKMPPCQVQTSRIDFRKIFGESDTREEQSNDNT